MGPITNAEHALKREVLLAVAQQPLLPGGQSEEPKGMVRARYNQWRKHAAHLEEEGAFVEAAEVWKAIGCVRRARKAQERGWAQTH